MTGFRICSQNSASAPAAGSKRSRAQGEAGPGGLLRHRQHHLDQRDAVGVAVVDAHHQGAAAVVVVDQVELPERLGRSRAASRRGRSRRPAARPCRPCRAAPPGGRASRCRSPRRPPTRRRSGPAPPSAGSAGRRGSAARACASACFTSSRPSNMSTPTITMRLVGQVHAQPRGVHAGYAFSADLGHRGRLLVGLSGDPRRCGGRAVSANFSTNPVAAMGRGEPGWRT